MYKRKQKAKPRKEKKDDCPENVIYEAAGVHQDFNFLINAPVTEDADFVFKSERTCAVDYGNYADFFTLNLRVVSAALRSIPFHEKVDIERKYFTKDQVTSIHNNAEKAKKSYAELLQTLDAEEKEASESQAAESLENLEDDNLDFLLTLDEPVPAPLSVYGSSASYRAPAAATEKSPNLDEWLNDFLDGTD